MPDQFCLVHQLVGPTGAIHRCDDTEVAPDSTAEVYKGDNEYDLLVGGHYERCCCNIPTPRIDRVRVYEAKTGRNR